MPEAPPTCGFQDSSSSDAQPCRGQRVRRWDACLRHLPDDQRIEYFRSLSATSHVKHRNTTFRGSLLRDLIRALQDADGIATFGQADFSGSTFEVPARFNQARFAGPTRFTNCTFLGAADFNHAEFEGMATFETSIFHGEVDFVGSDFNKLADFERCKFMESARFSASRFRVAAVFRYTGFEAGAFFSQSRFEQHARFTSATFKAVARLEECSFSQFTEFDSVTFAGACHFNGSVFESSAELGPLRCHSELDLSHCAFKSPITITAVSDSVKCERTRWESTAALRLRHSDLDLTDAVLNFPVAATSQSGQFSLAPNGLDQPELRVLSLRGVDCSLLTLSDADLTHCQFQGAIHLDQLRIEGRHCFGRPPNTRCWIRGVPFKWAQRQVIVEEILWRREPERPSSLRSGWHFPQERTHGQPDLSTVAVIYRQLRKAREDAKDEPGAADFYYGEMEMRRHGRKWDEAERWLLQAYWLLSGYGLRASRALGWLVLAMMTTVLLMMGFGLPQDSPKQEAIGTVPPGGGEVTFEIDKDDPQNPTYDRFTGKRFEKALSVTLNSVVFRSSGQDLTTAGGYIEMASRFSEPVLLGLAVLAIRGRVKR
ncbi:pentapeptide repeat-containing protein [Streptomyces coeruleorubidus]|uniref:pentapeptide repeat-containing protein n=1 Tax=Streptomyces coeruleorubidus TaxID=116188 RepID=UPI0033E90C80